VRKPTIAFFAIGLTLLSLTSCRRKNGITQDELVRRTQELFDSVAARRPDSLEKVLCRRLHVL
jgi:hypothetical protein